MDIGLIGEQFAADYLVNKGYVVLEKNYVCKGGEIDIIAKDGKCIVFIEVKARYASSVSKPYQAVTSLKKLKMRKCAKQYVYRNNMQYCTLRMDVMSLYIYSNGSLGQLKHFKNVSF